MVFVRNAESVVVTLHDLAMDSFYNKDRGGQLSAEASFKTRQNPPSFGGCFAEVEVDIELCKVRISHILNVHDAGVIINPALATAQVHGGMGMGIGWALYEELLVDPATGRVHNNNLLDYKFPTTCDIPDLDCAFVETQEPSGVYGNKSLGEPPLISPAPALRQRRPRRDRRRRQRHPHDAEAAVRGIREGWIGQGIENYRGGECPACPLYGDSAKRGLFPSPHPPKIFVCGLQGGDEMMGRPENKPRATFERRRFI